MSSKNCSSLLLAIGYWRFREYKEFSEFRERRITNFLFQFYSSLNTLSERQEYLVNSVTNAVELPQANLCVAGKKSISDSIAKKNSTHISIFANSGASSFIYIQNRPLITQAPMPIHLITV